MPALGRKTTGGERAVIGQFQTVSTALQSGNWSLSRTSVLCQNLASPPSLTQAGIIGAQIIKKGMSINVRDPVHISHRQSQFDPTGEVDLEDSVAVEMAVRKILDHHYSGRYDVALLGSAIADLVRAHRGDYPGLLHCDALYHDLRHSLDTALTMARLLDGYATSQAPTGSEGISADHALLGILLALFHDIGLLRRDAEADLWGPALTPIHEERGVEFMEDYLSHTTLSPLAGEAKLIMATKLVYKMPDNWTTGERLLASLAATADLVSQVADRFYLEKCRDFLFREFCAFGLAGKPDSLYPDSQTLLKKTPEFIEGFLQKRLDGEFQGVRRYLRTHMGSADPWEEAVQGNLGYLKTLLDSGNLNQLRRMPEPFNGDLPNEDSGPR